MREFLEQKQKSKITCPGEEKKF